MKIPKSAVVCRIRQRVRFLALVAICVSLLTACAPTTTQLFDTRNVSQMAADQIWILNVSTMIDDEWRHVPVRRKTQYQIISIDDRLSIRARGNDSASGLLREIEIDAKRCPVIEWSWRVDKFQQDADLNVKEKDDVAASIFLIFGDPGLAWAMKPVPTLRYVWTNGRAPIGSVVQNPYFTSVKSIALRSGDASAGQWVSERRNILSDFKHAFGHFPVESIHGFAIFTDNDQTKQPVEAYYEWIRVTCPI